jgi:hypothetical protein
MAYNDLWNAEIDAFIDETIKDDGQVTINLLPRE